jgi:hypothetical protein
MQGRKARGAMLLVICKMARGNESVELKMWLSKYAVLVMQNESINPRCDKSHK